MRSQILNYKGENMMKKVKFLSMLSSITFVIATMCIPFSVFAADVSTQDKSVLAKMDIQNAGFEEISSDTVKEPLLNWTYDFYYKDDKYSTLTVDKNEHHSGKNSVRLDSIQPNDARMFQEFTAEPDSLYRLTAWVKTKNIGTAQIGANLSVRDIPFTPSDLKGNTTEWKKLTTYIMTGKDIHSIKMSFGIGGYGSLNTGTAWFDDIVAEKVDQMPADGPFISLNPPQVDGIANGQSQDGSAESTSQPNTTMIYAITFIVMAGLVFLVYRMSVKGEQKVVDNNGELNEELIVPDEAIVPEKIVPEKIEVPAKSTVPVKSSTSDKIKSQVKTGESTNVIKKNAKKEFYQEEN